MTQRDSYDVIIIGTGAGGGTLAYQLAPTGKRILLIERGGFLPREHENLGPIEFSCRRCQANETWYDRFDQPFRRTPAGSGKRTRVYGNPCSGCAKGDFGAVRHYGGVSPAWPLHYSDFAPYYSQAERLYSVRGRRGADPCDPPADGDYAHPPLEHEPRMQEVFDDLRAGGLRPFSIPIGLRLPSESSGHAPYRLGRFDGYPDLTEVKSDAHVVAVQPALEHSNVEILTNAKAERLLTNASGRAITGVVVQRQGESITLRADVVVVACGAINSAALLLRSASEHHPHGLANSSGLVGRNYMCHNNGLLLAVCDSPNPSRFQKTFGVTDFYHGAADSQLPLGTIQLMGKPDEDTVRFMGQEVLPGRDPHEILSQSIDFFITAEDLPDAENRVSLRPDGAIRVSYTPNNLEAYERLRGKLEAAL